MLLNCSSAYIIWLKIGRIWNNNLDAWPWAGVVVKWSACWPSTPTIRVWIPLRLAHINKQTPKYFLPFCSWKTVWWDLLLAGSMSIGDPITASKGVVEDYKKQFVWEPMKYAFCFPDATVFIGEDSRILLPDIIENQISHQYENQ